MRKKILISVIISLFLITVSYVRPIPIAIEPQSFPFESVQQGVRVSSKQYGEIESKAYLHSNLLSLGYKPVEITIKNYTGKSYALSAASVPLSCATSGDVAWSMTKKRIPASLGLKIASFFFWPLAIPSAIEGIYTYKSHRALSKDLEAKTLKEKEEIIPPYATVTRVLYVKEKGFQEAFSVALQEINGKEFLVIPTTIS